MPSRQSTHNIPDGSVDASPTKRFFISVLVKDIEFIDALIELVDNSVDAVRAAYPGSKIKNGFVKINFDNRRIQVKDNGEGISIQQAKYNTFRFGRSETSKVNAGSVGAFGVGMKRALFKLGRHFSVDSQTKKERFIVKVEVSEWEKTDDGTEWLFPMVEEATGLSNRETGTDVIISKLHEYSSEQLRTSAFTVALIDRIQDVHAAALSDGLKIYINDIPLDASAPELLKSSKLQPIHTETTFKVGSAQITARIFAGVGEEEKLTDAGWYVFCNGRQIEKAEKTKRTGWASALDAETKTPRPHWQFRRFRGYIFFDSADSQVLPWNTMKTGLNVEAPAYRRVWEDMMIALRDVIAFLNALDAEEDDDGPLHAALEGAKPVQLKRLPQNAYFKYPTGKGSSASLTTISFRKEAEIVALVKEELGVQKNYEVGEKVFDYYVRMKKLS